MSKALREERFHWPSSQLFSAVLGSLFFSEKMELGCKAHSCQGQHADVSFVQQRSEILFVPRACLYSTQPGRVFWILVTPSCPSSSLLQPILFPVQV